MGSEHRDRRRWRSRVFLPSSLRKTIRSQRIRTSRARKGGPRISSPPCPILVKKVRNVLQCFVADIALGQLARLRVLEQPHRVEHRAGDLCCVGRATEQSVKGCRYRNRFTHCIHADDKRSEEHTSELQSHVNLVCRLLL